MARSLLPLGAAAAALLSAQGAAGQAMLVNGGVNYNVKVISFRDIPFRTVVRQQYDYSCGSAAVATLLHHHYGRPTGEAEVFKAMFLAGDQPKIRKVGFSLLDMKLYLESQGYAADGYRVNLTQLANLKRPAIATIKVGDYRHFVVIKGVRDGRVLVGDPALGLRAYDAEEFESMWNGVVFVIHSPPERPPVYDREDEWRPWAAAPVGSQLSDHTLAAFTRELPPLYQVAPMDIMPGIAP